MTSLESSEQAAGLELSGASAIGSASLPSVSEAVIQVIVDRSLASVLVCLVKAIDDWLEDFKQHFPLSSTDSREHLSNQLKIEAKPI